MATTQQAAPSATLLQTSSRGQSLMLMLGMDKPRHLDFRLPMSQSLENWSHRPAVAQRSRKAVSTTPVFGNKLLSPFILVYQT